MHRADWQPEFCSFPKPATDGGCGLRLRTTSLHANAIEPGPTEGLSRMSLVKRRLYRHHSSRERCLAPILLTRLGRVQVKNVGEEWLKVDEMRPDKRE